MARFNMAFTDRGTFLAEVWLIVNTPIALE